MTCGKTIYSPKHAQFNYPPNTGFVHADTGLCWSNGSQGADPLRAWVAGHEPDVPMPHPAIPLADPADRYMARLNM
jgi:hypothetical protein